MTHGTLSRGFTLIEMLVVISIILIMVPTLFLTILSLYDSHDSSLSQAFAISETTKGMKKMVSDVRSAVYGEDGSLPIVAIGTSTITFYCDTDYDGAVERVRYFLQNDTVRKGVIEPTATSSYPTSLEVTRDLVQGIVNADTGTPIFRYYSATSSEITVASQVMLVRRVDMQLIGSTRYGRSTALTPIRSSASIRNLKDAY